MIRRLRNSDWICLQVYNLLTLWDMSIQRLWLTEKEIEAEQGRTNFLTSLTHTSTGLSGTQFSTLNSAGINDCEGPRKCVTILIDLFCRLTIMTLQIQFISYIVFRKKIWQITLFPLCLFLTQVSHIMETSTITSRKMVKKKAQEAKK
jgi:hypothetical protein